MSIERRGELWPRLEDEWDTGSKRRESTDNSLYMIVLGDRLTGKSSLIKSLSSYGKEGILTCGSSDICMLEYHNGSEDTVPAENVDLVVVTIDIRVQESAHNAFTRWWQVKEKYFKSSLLIFVGTFLDAVIDRKVEIVEATRASVKKDAIYMEISNTTHENCTKLKDIIDRFENDMHNMKKFLEENSEIDTKEKVELNHVGHHLTDLLERLDEKADEDIMSKSSASVAPLDHDINSQEELFESLRILGLSVPSAMLLGSSPNPESNPLMEHKIKITLPDDKGEATFHLYDGYDVQSQVQDFMTLYGIEENTSAKNRILAIAQRVVSKASGSIKNNANGSDE